jgi:mono/diheme cytochrome c family protein
MEELLAAAAAALNAPEAMVERSAQARAQADGVSIEDVLTAWAGGDAIPAAAPAAPAPPTADSAPAAAAPPTAPAAESAPVVADPSNQDSLIAAAAVKMNMPESMIRRSAEARARAAETDVQSILLEWAGVDPDAAPPPAAPAAEAPAAPAAPAAEAAAEPAPPAAPAAAPAGGGMDEAAMLAAAAEKMGMSESMIKRSAGARAKAAGVDPSVIIAEWAGVEAAPASAGPAADAPPAEAPAPAAPAPSEPAAPSAPDVEVLGGDDESAEVTVPAMDDDYEPEEVAVAAGALPRWLAALFVVVPAIAIGYALFFPNGPNCGDAGSLAVDPVTGLAVNCDGSEYGVEEVDLFSLGQEIYNGVGCAACHGANGAGVANFPAFTGGSLLTTFPQDWCIAQVEWIALGTAGWPEPTYGATEKPVGGSGAVMPGFEGTLSPEEIVAVTLYERVAFGGQDLAAAEADCSGAGDEMTSAMGGG